MSEDSDKSPEFSGRQPGFATTHWSLVLLAGNSAAEGSREALSTLCSSYWYPLYAYVRRQGHASADAQDLTQAFFASLLEKQDFAVVDRSKGRFRAFLLASLRHFLINDWDRERTAKRGGGVAKLSLDFEAGETLFRLEPSHAQTAEVIFEREWAQTLLDQVRTKLRAEYQAEQKQQQLELLENFLTGERNSVSYREVGEKLGMTENAVKVVVHRLRRRFRDILRDEIRSTVASVEEVDEEVRALFAALGK